MARLPIPPINPNNRIPNNPFYAPTQNYLKGEYSPFIIGSGLNLDLFTGVLSATGGVAGLVAGLGIDVVTGGSPPGSTATISNTGLLSIAALSPVIAGGTVQNPILSVASASTSSLGVVQLSDSVASTSSTEAATSNAVKIAYDAALASVQLVSVAAPITVSGVSTNPTVGVSVATAVTTGVVSVGANISVSPAGAISVATSSTTVPGIVQLNNTTSSTLTTEALTAAQGKSLQDQISALVITSNLTFAGTLDTVTGNMLTVTGAGTSAGFVVGSPLPAAAPLNDECFVIVEVAAVSYTPPGGVATQTHVGDWFLSDGTAWSFLNVGFDPPYATTTAPGVVELATSAETQTGTDATLAVTPASAAATYVPLGDYAAKGDILVGSSASNPTALTVGTTGQILYANSASPTGVTWGTGPITCADFDVKGELLVGFANDSYGTLSVGTDGQILYACNAAVSGLCWAVPPVTAAATPLAIGTVFGCTLNTNITALGYNTLAANVSATGSTAVGGCALCAVTTGTCNIAIGDNAATTIVTESNNVVIGSNVTIPTAGNDCQLAIGYASGQCWLTGDDTRNIRPGAGIVDCTASAGTAGQVLSSTGSAIEWVTAPSPSAATPTALGTVYGCTVADCTALGLNALDANTGTGNTALGNNAMQANTTGCYNTAVGHLAIACSDLGQENTAIGFCSGTCLSGNSCRNVFVGALSGSLATDGFNNVGVGYQAACSLTTGTGNVAVGSGAGQLLNAGFGNVFLGRRSGCSTTTASINIAIGECALLANSTGCQNIALGYLSLCSLTTGIGNIAIGRSGVGSCLSTECFNVVIGSNSAASLVGCNNHILLADGCGCPRVVWDNGGAMSPGGSGNYGTLGQVLTSNGPGALPTWNSAGGGGATQLYSGTFTTTGGSSATMGCWPTGTAAPAPAALSATIYTSICNSAGVIVDWGNIQVNASGSIQGQFGACTACLASKSGVTTCILAVGANYSAFTDVSIIWNSSAALPLDTYTYNMAITQYGGNTSFTAL